MRNFCLSLLALSCCFQLSFSQDLVPANIEVREDGAILSNPFAGGMNQPQFSAIDIDLDGKEDLLAFDRAGNKILTFLNLGKAGESNYVYAPEYESAFPPMEDWVLARDFDCDGKVDLFTSTPGINAVAIYQNVSDSDTLLFKLRTTQLREQVNNWVVAISSQDLPALDDVDGDGDLDILTFDSGGFAVLWFKNYSQELFGNCDSLHFEQETACWGEFMENGINNTITLGVTCKSGQTGNSPSIASGRHAGSTLCTFDIDADSAKELLLGDLSHDNIVYLHNGGSPDYAQMDTSHYFFPIFAPARIEIFPGAFYLDVNNDQQKDLLVAPNALNISANYRQSLLYTDQNLSDSVSFAFGGNEFLLEDMIECGESTYPVFFDYDGDGLQDLVVGNYRYKSSSTNEWSGLTLYRNIGTAQVPAFELQTRDYLGLSTFFNPQEFGLAPTFGDIDNDKDLDLILGTFNGKIHLFINNGGQGDSAEFSLQAAEYANIDVGQNSTPQLVDVNRDGKIDLLIGESNGNINYYKNTGSRTNPSFSDQATTTSFGGIKMPGGFAAYSTPRMVKNAQGAYELFVGGEVGSIYRYSNIDNNLTGNFTLEDSLYGGIDLGTRSSLDIWDIDSDGKVEFAVGNKRGGVGVYDSELITTSLDYILPGTSEGGFSLREIGGERQLEILFRGKPWAHLEFQLISLNGQVLLEGSHRHYQQSIMLDLPSLASGMYLIRAIFDGKKAFTQKWIRQ